MATAQERAEKRAKQKAAKQKRLLIVLIPVLVALLAWQGPKLLKQVKGGSQAAAPAPASTDAGETGQVPAAPGATVPAVGGTPNAVAVGDVHVLPKNSDVPIPADEGQLISFSRFEARDPFVQLVDDTDTSTTSSGSTDTSSGGSAAPTDTTGSTGSGGDYTPQPPPTTTPPPSDGGGTTATSVTLSVNAKIEVHIVGDTFPAGDPAFRVISISSDAVVIGLTDGSFDGGGQTVEVKKGQSVTLVSQPDGARFTIKVVSIT